MSEKTITLSLETAIGGGSISILEEGTEVDSWVGESRAFGSENVLAQIESLLRKNRISKNQIGLIAFSKGPGSFTGLRIGLALTKGFQKSLRCDVKCVSVLEAMTFTSEPSKNMLTAIPFGNKQICHQFFKAEKDNSLSGEQIKISSSDAFTKELADIKTPENIILVLHTKVFEENEFSVSRDVWNGFYKVENVFNPAKNIGLLAKWLESNSASDNKILSQKNNNELIYLSKFTNIATL